MVEYFFLMYMLVNDQLVVINEPMITQQSCEEFKRKLEADLKARERLLSNRIITSGCYQR